MATRFSSDNIPFPRYICNICDRADNFNGFIPSEHSDHSLTCAICHLVLHNARSALLHLSGHQPPIARRVCLSPPPPPPATPASPPPDLSSIRASTSVVPETLDSPSLHLTPPEIVQSPDTSPSLQPAQRSPLPPPTSTMPSPQSVPSGNDILCLCTRLRFVTAHLGLAAMTAQLPPLTADMLQLLQLELTLLCRLPQRVFRFAACSTLSSLQLCRKRTPCLLLTLLVLCCLCMSIGLMRPIPINCLLFYVMSFNFSLS